MKRLLLAFALLLASSVALAAVNINTATKEQLDALPGIGPVKAQAIIDYRNANGPFRSAEDVMKVRGIKEGEFGKIRDQISVSGATSVPAQPQREPARTAAPPTRTAPAAPSRAAAPPPSATPPAAAPAPAAPTTATAPAAGAKMTRDEQKAARAKAKEEKAAKAKEDKEAKAREKADKAAKAKEEKAARAEAKKGNASAKAKAASDETPATSAKAKP
jgi:competence protein ComEA